MADETLTRGIRMRLRARRAALIEAVVSGTPKDYAAYKHMIGKIAALNDAEDDVVEATRSFFGEEDDSDD